MNQILVGEEATRLWCLEASSFNKAGHKTRIVKFKTISFKIKMDGKLMGPIFLEKLQKNESRTRSNSSSWLLLKVQNFYSAANRLVF